ncbi:hydrogenase assembly protein HupF [Desulfocarbo indianensis]|nr:hydrogenase assembly protein HupF [Desulfocarbo indianensis]
MKHADEFRDPQLTRNLARAITAASRKPVRFMELCGTHTMAIARHGLLEMLPPTVELVSGPGCPVCVTATEEIDRAVKLARQPGVVVATFGDLLRVPGSQSSLARERAAGAKVEIVYSPLDALELAKRQTASQVVFLGIGFETTAPTVAAAMAMAKNQGLLNFSVLAAHKLLPPAMEALLTGPSLGLHGFICPGHVTTVIGTAAYEEVVARHGLPCVVAGFEPADILATLLMLVKQAEAGQARVEIQYRRAVSPQGNPQAREMMNQVFQPVDAAWRGLGVIPQSGLEPGPDYRELDARRRFDLEVPPAHDPPACRCGDVLRGLCRPPDCKLFAAVCTPTQPVGPCMVSQEGTCAAWFKYRRA